MSRLRRLVVLLAGCLALPVLAWPLLGPRDEAATAVPDAVVRLQFPFRTVPAPDPRGWQVKATYRASQPEQKGVQKETHKHSNCPGGELAIPFCSTSRERVAVERTLVLRPQWLRVAKGGDIELGVPERLAGPGDYRLATLDLPCLVRACTNGESHPVSLLFSTHTDASSTLPGFIDLDTTQPADVFTAAYAGTLLSLEPSEGSRERVKAAIDPGERFRLRALQDAAGRWHVSPSVFVLPLGFDNRSAQPVESQLSVPVEDFPALAWAVRYDRVERSRVVGLDTMDNDRQWHHARPDDWTGCIAIRAYRRNAVGDEDLRTYCFDRGHAAYRRIQRSSGGREWTDELAEIDGDARLLFESRNTWHGNDSPEPKRWSRLMQEAWPDVAQPRPATDVPALLREAEDVRRLITPEFKP